MAFDPNEQFTLPPDTDADDVLRKLLRKEDDSVSDDPEEEPEEN
jgi:hypothetical protein